MIAHIGCGYWGKNIASTLYKQNLLSEIYDFDSEVNAEFSKKYNLKTISSMSEILSNSDVIACSLATPAISHYELSKDILNSGKHLFVEKPICLSVNEAVALRDIANQNSLKIMVGHLMHYHAGFKKMKKILFGNELGAIRRIKSYRKSFGILRSDEDVIWSFAPHDISMALSVTSSFEYDDLNVTRKKFFDENTDSANISFTSNDIKVEIDLDWSSSYKQQRFEVYCENGIAVLDDTLPENEKLFVIETKFSQFQLKTKNILSQKFIPCDYSLLPLEAELLEFKNLITHKIHDCYNNAEEAISVLKVLKEAESYE